jgi:hypothetical protein
LYFISNVVDVDDDEVVVERRFPVKDDGVKAAAEPTRREESTSFIGDNLVVVGEVRYCRSVFDGIRRYVRRMRVDVWMQKKRISSRTGFPGLFSGGNSCRFFGGGKGLRLDFT